MLKNEKVLNKLAEIKDQYPLEIGISCTGSNQTEVIKEALDVEVNGIELFTSFQVTFNIFEQALLNVKNLIESAGKKIIVKEALANGRVFPNSAYPKYSKVYK